MPTVRLPLRVDDREVLRYLGFKPGVDPSTVETRVLELLTETKARAQRHLLPHASYATYDAVATPDGFCVPGIIDLRSASLKAHLRGSRRLTFLAVTIGDSLDRQTSALSATGRMAEAATLDALGSNAVEEAADALCARLAAEAAEHGFHLTSRFSPGYGDLGLETQPDFVTAAHADDVGISVSSSMMLSPMKSITAVAGWLAAAQGQPSASLPVGCDSCGLTSCRYRRPGPEE